MRGAFDKKISQSSRPSISIFKKFQESWPKICKQKFIPGIKDEYVRQSIQDTNEVLEFAMQTLQKVKQLREDYREFLELVIIFLGGTPPRGISFRGPGAFHHARWMAKAIYCLKIYLFRGEFTLTKEEKNGIRDICIFLVKLYLKVWI